MPAPAYSTIPYLLQVGLRADQPLATDVGIGTLYSVSDEGFLIEQSDGATWGQWGPAGSGSSLPATVQGDMLYASAADTISALAKTTSRRSLVNTGATNNPAWSGAQILIAQVDLTDAEIKGLPTVAKTLVAAPGVGFYLVLHMLTLRSNFTAGAYTNINATYAALFGLLGTVGALSQFIADDAALSPAPVALTSFLGASARVVSLPPYSESVPGAAGTAGWVFQSYSAGGELVSDTENKAFTLVADNNGSGDWTGGNAANTLRATVYYSIEATS